MRIITLTAFIICLQTQAAYVNRQQPTIPFERHVYEFGFAKNYEALETLINQASMAHMKDLVLAELDLALFITARVNFDLTNENDSTSFHYAEQTLLRYPRCRIRAQWAYLLLEAKYDLESKNNFNIDTLEYPISLIAYFLNDMGTLVTPYQPAKNVGEAKQRLFLYAQKLFDIYSLVQHKRPYPEVAEMQRIIAHRPQRLNRPVRLSPVSKPAAARPTPTHPKPVKLIPVTKPAPAKPKPVKLVPLTKPAPAQPRI